MVYQPIPDVAVDELWDEDDFNLVGDDFAANIPDIFTVAGQIGAASGANALAAVDMGANFTALTADSAQPGGIAWAGGVVRIGMIIIWSGAVGSIPTGWNLCDGSNGTPDLRDKFVIGAGDTYNPGDTGGGAAINLQHSHTPNQANVDNYDNIHNHTQLNTGDAGSHSHTVPATVTGGPSLTTTDRGVSESGSSRPTSTHTHTFTTPSSTQSDHAHTNPNTNNNASSPHNHSIGTPSNALNTSYKAPQYALCYIMRIS